MMASQTPATAVTFADRLYGAAARCAFPPVWLGAWLFGVSAQQLRARTGTMPDAARPLVWFHGASAGEMAAAARLAAALRQHGHRFTAAYTATNSAGLELAGRLAGPDSVTALVPWDHPRWVARAFDRWQPRLLALVETELWPGLILEAHRRSIPVFCVSARIYPRDVARYRLIRALTVPMLRRLTGVLAQNEVERDRFIALGAAPDRCTVSGNLKYLVVDPVSVAAAGERCALRAELHLGNDDHVVVCGSVHADEIPSLFGALDQLPPGHVRAIIAPRHAGAVAAIVRASQQRGWKSHRRGTGAAPADWRVLVLDRMGELLPAYAIASAAVIGGGFGTHGGHNPLEPVMAGAPVIFGHHFDHFPQEAADLAAAAPEARVRAAAELGQRLAEWLTDDARRQRILALQRQVLPDGAAIARCYVTALSPWLERGQG
jgi:3-deoxy-D-manno-octulosonic-acid transferase